MKKSEALKILGLSEGASEEDIKKAHRKLVIENHPDKFGQDPQRRVEAEEKTKLINEARDVLINRSWEPEYATAGTPYGAPFSYSPYQGSPTNSAGDPFAQWPFSESFVWTTWEENGRRTTYTATGTDPFASGPFDPFDAFRATGTGNPFSGTHRGGAYTGFDAFSDLFSTFIPREPTIEEKILEAKEDLQLDAKLIAAKAALLALSCLLSAPATGLYLYTIVSIGQGIWKRLSFLSLVLLIPFAMLAIIFTPKADAAIGIIALALFVLSVGFDASNVYRHVKRIHQLRRKVG